ncbi:hypothetical protein AABB24_004166, partial [Solanum stoloniferum]
LSLPLSPKFSRTLISSIHRQHTTFLDRSVRFLFLYTRLTMESSSSVITPEDVMGTLMNDGTIDSMRLKIITQLKANEELKNTTIKMVEQSRVLYTSGAEKQTKRELFDALRQELEYVCYFFWFGFSIISRKLNLTAST